LAFYVNPHEEKEEKKGEINVKSLKSFLILLHVSLVPQIALRTT
jgi:hypothetical protein